MEVAIVLGAANPLLRLKKGRGAEWKSFIYVSVDEIKTRLTEKIGFIYP